MSEGGRLLFVTLHTFFLHRRRRALRMASGPVLRLVCSDELGYVRTLQAPSAQSVGAASVVARWGDGQRAGAVERLSLSDGGEEVASLLAGAAALASLPGPSVDLSLPCAPVARVSGALDVVDPLDGSVLCTLQRRVQPPARALPSCAPPDSTAQRCLLPRPSPCIASGRGRGTPLAVLLRARGGASARAVPGRGVEAGIHPVRPWRNQLCDLSDRGFARGGGG